MLEALELKARREYRFYQLSKYNKIRDEREIQWIYSYGTMSIKAFLR